MDRIINFRSKIDEIDDKIMSLLEERYNISEEIGQAKSKSNSDVLDLKREKKILDKASQYSHSTQIEAVYQSIFIQSKELQRK